jgi:FkbM family methyltransferase
MFSGLKRLVQGTLKKNFNIVIAKYDYVCRLQGRLKGGNVVAILSEYKPGQDVQLDQEDAKLIRAIRTSKSQLGQDIFVLCQTGFKSNGYFVEFGATNGVDLSNSYVLEKEFGWNGIVAEPASRWHPELKRNRGCNIETECVWSKSNVVLTFNEADWGELSTINLLSGSDSHHLTRESGKTYNVNTISLTDMLDKYGAPRRIDFLSVDTEGSEFEILNNFDFNKYQFGVIVCEHNYTPKREEIYSLLTANGYVRKCQDISEFDDWYVRVE